ncbi:hypothetical protein MUK42_18991 [Musa troglodytarum]|uniref:Uncharacterized protein n=1 Tax=Musa troglodytarum TaxID=320322 RepID=A0A9E7FXI2_9LILI|nr:hypothetical protein MUK42_18991 [Musa troglodytarum]
MPPFFCQLSIDTTNTHTPHPLSPSPPQLSSSLFKHNGLRPASNATTSICATSSKGIPVYTTAAESPEPPTTLTFEASTTSTTSPHTPATPTSEESATATTSPQPPATTTAKPPATTTAKKDGPASAEAATATAASGTRPPSTTVASATEPEPHRHHRRVRLPRRPSPPRIPRRGTVLLHQEEKEEDDRQKRRRGGPRARPRDCRSRTPWPTTDDPVGRRRHQSP